MTDRPEVERIADAIGGPVVLVVPLKRLIRWIFGTCIAVEVLLVLLDYHVNFSHATEIGALRRLTNITREDSLASWFGTTQTLLVALTLWLTYLCVRGRGGPRWRSPGWLVLALFFSFMTIDDGSQLHERFGTVFDTVFGGDPDPGGTVALGTRLLDAFPSYAWQIVVLPFFVALGGFVAVFLWRELPRRRARVLVFLALTCFAVAVGLDFFEGLSSDHPWNVYTRITEAVDFGDSTEFRFRRSAYDTLGHFSKSIEEFLEMLGNTLLWVVFLRHLSVVAGDLRIRFIES